MRTIGIDPGLTGAVVAIDQSGVVGCWDAPTFKAVRGRDYLYSEMVSILLNARGKQADAWIEEQRPHPGEGVLSCFRIGVGYGAWLAALAAAGIATNVVYSQHWQKEAYRGVNADKKERSIVAASRLFPTLELRGPKGGAKHGRADAALIAWYGARRTA